MTNTAKILEAKKYTILNLVQKKPHTINKAPKHKEDILKALEMSNTTFWRKCRAKVKEPSGFEICQLKQIADIMELDLMELLTLEAKIYYKF